MAGYRGWGTTGEMLTTIQSRGVTHVLLTCADSTAPRQSVEVGGRVQGLGDNWRNVDNNPVSWCYTRDVNVRWQYCFETVCGGRW